MNKSATFYTDGACSGNPGPGGWCYVELVPCEEGFVTKCITGNKKNTTNGEMELTAVYMAMVCAMKAGKTRAVIVTDSKYVVDAIEKDWLKKWFRNGWKTVKGDEVKNRHIWEKVYRIISEKIDIKMVHVRGHNGNILNELADEKAVEARKEIEQHEE